MPVDPPPPPHPTAPDHGPQDWQEAVAAPPSGRRGPGILMARGLATGAVIACSAAFAAAAILIAPPPSDRDTWRQAAQSAEQGDVFAALDRVAALEAMLDHASNGLMLLALVTLIAALMVYIALSRIIGGATQSLADSIAEASRAKTLTAVWGRDRRDALGAIARAAEFLHWERLSRDTTSPIVHEHLTTMEHAVAKSVRLQDALARSVTAASQTCNDFNTVLERAEKALALAGNTAWDRADAQGEQLKEAVIQLRGLGEEWRAAAGEAVARDAQTAAAVEGVIAPLSAAADAALRLNDNASAFEARMIAHNDRAASVLADLQTHDWDAGRSAVDARLDAFAERLDAMLHHAEPPDFHALLAALDSILAEAQTLSHTLAGALTQADAHADVLRAVQADLAQAQQDAAASEHGRLDTFADPRLDDAVARLEAQITALAALQLEADASQADAPAIPDWAPLQEDVRALAVAAERAEAAGRTADTAMAGLSTSFTQALASLHEKLDALAESQPPSGTPVIDDAPLQPVLDAVSSLSDQISAATHTLTDELMTAKTSLDHAAGDLRAAMPDTNVLSQALESWLQRQLAPLLAPLTRLDALAAQIKLVEDRLAEAAPGSPSAPGVDSDEVARAVVQELQQSLETALSPKLDTLDAMTARLETTAQAAATVEAAPASHDAPAVPDLSHLPAFEPERAGFRRIMVGFDLVLRDLQARVAQVGDIAAAPSAADAPSFDAVSQALAELETRLKTLADQAQPTADDAAAPAPDTAPDTTPAAPFGAERTSFQQIAIGYRHVLRELDAQAQALRETLSRVEEAAPAAPAPLEGEVLSPAPALETHEAHRDGLRRVVDGFRTALQRVEVEIDALHTGVADVKTAAVSLAALGGAPAPQAPANVDTAPLDALTSRLETAIEALNSTARDATSASPSPDNAVSTDAALRALDRLSAQMAGMNDAIARQSDVLRAVIEDGGDGQQGRAQHLVERLERAARETRAHTSEFLAIAAALSRDMDHQRALRDLHTTALLEAKGDQPSPAAAAE